MQMLAQICEKNLDNFICTNSDEIIIQVLNFDEADKIINLVNIPSGFRVQKFQLHKIDYYVPNYMYKEYSNDNKNKVLVNVHPEDYDQLYKQYIIC